jgi:ElaA protein
MDTNQAIRWVFKPYQELTVDELYELLALRSKVFVVEQQCIFLDMDGLDKQAHHLLGFVDGGLVACTRILPAGTAYAEYPSIGRVVTAPEARGKSYGFLLMQQSAEKLYSLYGNVSIKIGAQLYLKRFYESLGFRQSGEMYLEDGIEHIPMIKPVE